MEAVNAKMSLKLVRDAKLSKKMNKHELENLEPLLGQMKSHLKIIQRDKNSNFLSLMVFVKITVCKWERFEKT